MPGEGMARESFAVLLEPRVFGDKAAEEHISREATARIVAEVDVRPAMVRVLPPGALPKTPSGKLRRTAARAFALRVRASAWSIDLVRRCRRPLSGS